jgi:hypothetical protein
MNRGPQQAPFLRLLGRNVLDELVAGVFWFSRFVARKVEVIIVVSASPGYFDILSALALSSSHP